MVFVRKFLGQWGHEPVLTRAGWGLWLLWAAMLLALPLRWLAPAAVSIGVHELCHYGAIRLCGGRVSGIRLSLRGITMDCGCLTPWQELFCALAGPAGGIALMAISREMPRLCLCAFFHSACNLLPLYPLDGGRAVGSLMELLFPRRGPWLFWKFQQALRLFLLAVCLWAALFQGLGLIPLGLAAFLLINNPCKDAALAVQ